jgi:hypothetical protein
LQLESMFLRLLSFMLWSWSSTLKVAFTRLWHVGILWLVKHPNTFTKARLKQCARSTPFHMVLICVHNCFYCWKFAYFSTCLHHIRSQLDTPLQYTRIAWVVLKYGLFRKVFNNDLGKSQLYRCWGITFFLDYWERLR